MFFFILAGISWPLAAAAEVTNPSFEIGVGFTRHVNGEAVERACQGTIIARSRLTAGWVCTLLTATHCLIDEAADKKATFISTKALGLSRLTSVDAKSKDTRKAADDIAVAQFSQGCEKADGLVVSLHGRVVRDLAPDGMPTRVFVASRTFNRALPGVIRQRFQGAVAETPIEAIVSPEPIGRTPAALYPGDSGGGIFVRDAQTQALELVGVVSAIWLHGVKRAEVVAQRHLSKGSVEAIGSQDLAWVMRQTGADVTESFAPASAPAVGGKSIQLLETFLR